MTALATLTDATRMLAEARTLDYIAAALPAGKHRTAQLRTRGDHD